MDSSQMSDEEVRIARRRLQDGRSLAEDWSYDIGRDEIPPSGTARGTSSRYELRSASRIPHVTTDAETRSSRFGSFLSACRSMATSISAAATTLSRNAGSTLSSSSAFRLSPGQVRATDDRSRMSRDKGAEELGARPKEPRQDQTTLMLLEVEKKDVVDKRRRQSASLFSPFELHSVKLTSERQENAERRIEVENRPIVQGPVMSTRQYSSRVNAEPSGATALSERRQERWTCEGGAETRAIDRLITTAETTHLYGDQGATAVTIVRRPEGLMFDGNAETRATDRPVTMAGTTHLYGDQEAAAPGDESGDRRHLHRFSDGRVDTGRLGPQSSEYAGIRLEPGRGTKDSRERYFDRVGRHTPTLAWLKG